MTPDPYFLQIRPGTILRTVVNNGFFKNRCFSLYQGEEFFGRDMLTARLEMSFSHKIHIPEGVVPHHILGCFPFTTERTLFLIGERWQQ